MTSRKKLLINTHLSTIYIDSITPPSINIVYSLNKETNMENIEGIFEEARKYILSEEVFEDLQELHAKKFVYSFGKINIKFIYRENDKEFSCIFSASQQVNGAPNYKSFDTWYLRYNNETIREYIPTLKN